MGTKGPGFQRKPYVARVGRERGAALRHKSRANHGPGYAGGTMRRSYSGTLLPDTSLVRSALLVDYTYIKYITSNIWIRLSECMIKIKPITI